MAWNTEKDAHLRDCFDMGMTCSEAAMSINKRFGSDYSRNAIIGRAQRRGIPTADPVKGKHVRTRARKPQVWEASGLKRHTYFRQRKAEQAPPKIPTARAIAETFRCVEVNPLHLDLTTVVDKDGCRWPYGDSPFTFCGHTKLAGFSYCGPHFALSIGPGSMGEQNAHKVRRAA